MKKTVCKKEYDTETMTVVKKVAHGVYGDPAGYARIRRWKSRKRRHLPCVATDRRR